MAKTNHQKHRHTAGRAEKGRAPRRRRRAKGRQAMRQPLHFAGRLAYPHAPSLPRRMAARLGSGRMMEAIASELRQLADANRHVAWRHRLNTEDLGKHLAKEGRKIADRLGVEINETTLEFLARQVAWTCNIKVGAETNRLNARARRAVSRHETF